MRVAIGLAGGVSRLRGGGGRRRRRREEEAEEGRNRGCGRPALRA